MGAFTGCYALKSIVLPSGLQELETFALSESGLQSITYEGTTEQWDAIAKGQNWNKAISATVVHCLNGDVAI